MRSNQAEGNPHPDDSACHWERDGCDVLCEGLHVDVVDPDIIIIVVPPGLSCSPDPFPVRFLFVGEIMQEVAVIINIEHPALGASNACCNGSSLL
jgi:hypothetical protein